MKIRAWMIYLVGLAVAVAASQSIDDQIIAGSLVGEYMLYGGVVLVLYYLVVRLKFWKDKKKQTT